MKVVFWNVQRIGNVNPKSEEGSLRYGYFWATFKEFIANGADLILLCEISQNGADLAKEIKANFGGWTAEYVAVGCTRSDGVSPCGFLVAANGDFRFQPRGITSKRPAVAVGYGGEVITCCHIVATGADPSKEEILDFLMDMKAGSYLLGDMNYRIEKWELTDNKKEITALDVKAVKPGALAYTFQSKNNSKTKLLDYIFAPANAAVGSFEPTKSHDFDIIDHCPVGYIL